MAAPTASVLDALLHSGLLIQQDKRLPNVVVLVTGESLHTSWWSHPKAHLVFSVLSELSHHPDVLVTKLLYRKVTFVHRRLWPALLAVASAADPWQLHGLSPSARNLLSAVNASLVPVRATGQPVKELEFMLLARATQVHTESGRHETALETWSAWGRRVGVKPSRSSMLGRQLLEKAATALGASSSALPWPSDYGVAT